MIPIEKAIAGLQALKERGATHCWGWDDESIQVSHPDDEQITHHPKVTGYIDEEGTFVREKIVELGLKRYRNVKLDLG